MDVYTLRFLILYLIAVLPGIIFFYLGRKRIGIFFIIVTIAALLEFIFVKPDTPNKTLFGQTVFVSAILMFLIQIIYLTVIFICKISKRAKDSSTGIEIQANGEKRITRFTILDIIKGTLFAVGLVVVYYLLPGVYALFAYLIIKVSDMLGLYPVRSLVVFAFFILLVLVLTFSKVVESGFTLHNLFRSKDKDAKKDDG